MAARKFTVEATLRQRANNVGLLPGRLSVLRSVEGLLAIALGAVLALLRVDVVAAHTGDDATFKHVAIEFALWGIGLAAVLALLVAIFWVRARFLRQDP